MLRRLGRLASMAIPPSSMLYLPMQALVFWDIHVLAALERWRQDGGSNARDWLAVLGEAEALGALAGLRHDNPGWALPEIDAGRRHLSRQSARSSPPAGRRARLQ